MGARRAVPAAKASGRYRFGEGTFPRIPDNDGEAPGAVIRRGRSRRPVGKQRSAIEDLLKIALKQFADMVGHRLSP